MYELVNGIVAIIVGCFFYNVATKKPTNFKSESLYADWVFRNGKLLKVCGGAMIVLGVFRVFQVLL
ncbi:hypothetical protein ATN88_23635 [Enterovibrio coralii]|uniref:Uncharacterized protein n=1 Tax=Enterovibrio coralii TaxID=294935 RepID=A0A135IBM3_9GAMM|nr:hypothetical protein ATN88_23635 [Enterovibrio coralii]